MIGQEPDSTTTAMATVERIARIVDAMIRSPGQEIAMPFKPIPEGITPSRRT